MILISRVFQHTCICIVHCCLRPIEIKLSSCLSSLVFTPFIVDEQCIVLRCVSHGSLNISSPSFLICIMYSSITFTTAASRICTPFQHCLLFSYLLVLNVGLNGLELVIIHKYV
ncbi:hypothetical protein HanPI659440_Chr05g0213661 [Helianthus annuus]|nr:hypothetical protein HanPI659440_Chr05g0213661 [Helianthus annuus]